MTDDVQFVRNWMTTGVSDRAAAQGAIDYMFANHGGGNVIFPPAALHLDGPLVMKGDIRLVGCGAASQLTTDGADLPIIQMDNSVQFPEIESLFMVASQNANAQTNVVTVNRNIQAKISKSWIWGGSSALFTQGVDGVYTDLFIWGAGFSCVTSNGANWYKRCKMDSQPNMSPQFAIYLGSPIPECLGAMENSFEQCDASGPWTSGYALEVADNSTNVADTRFFGGIFSGGINLYQQRAAVFLGSKFGGPFNINQGSAQMGFCEYLGSGNLHVPASVVTAGNIKIVSP